MLFKIFLLDIDTSIMSQLPSNIQIIEPTVINLSILPLSFFTSKNHFNKINDLIKRFIINKIIKLFLSWLELNNTSIWCVTLFSILKIRNTKKNEWETSPNHKKFRRVS